MNEFSATIINFKSATVNKNYHNLNWASIAQSVASPTADPGIASSIPARSHTLVENFYGHSPPSTGSRRVVVSYKRMYVHEVQANRLVKLA